MAQIVKKESACNAGEPGLILGWDDPLEKGMATHSSILAWRVPWTEEPNGLQSMGSQGVGHNWATNTLIFTQSFSFVCFWMWFHLQVESYSMYSCVWLLLFIMVSVIFIQLVCILVICSFLWLYIILSYEYTTHVFIYSPVDRHFGCCQCWLVWTVLLWIFLYTYFGEHIHLFRLGMYSGVELLGHKVGVCLILVDFVKLFSKAVVIKLYSHQLYI